MLYLHADPYLNLPKIPQKIDSRYFKTVTSILKLLPTSYFVEMKSPSEEGFFTLEV